MIPFKTHRNWEDNPYAFWYVLLQLVYLVYSAKQIQRGYPMQTTRIQKRMGEDVTLYGYYYDKVVTLGEVNRRCTRRSRSCTRSTPSWSG